MLPLEDGQSVATGVVAVLFTAFELCVLLVKSQYSSHAIFGPRAVGDPLRKRRLAVCLSAVRAAVCTVRGSGRVRLSVLGLGVRGCGVAGSVVPAAVVAAFCEGEQGAGDGERDGQEKRECGARADEGAGGCCSG